MRWEAKRKSNRFARIAIKDIPVFKIAQTRNGLITPYFYSGNIIYIEGKTYVQPIWSLLLPKKYRSKGIHCYNNECVITIDYPYIVDVKGLYNGINRPLLQSYSLKPTVRMDSVIPKGTIFFENDIGEMVTTRLKILKIHKLTNEDEE